MGMRIACIDFHKRYTPKNKYDVTNSLTIIIDSEDVDALKMILKKADDKHFRYEYRELILYDESNHR